MVDLIVVGAAFAGLIATSEERVSVVEFGTLVKPGFGFDFCDEG